MRGLVLKCLACLIVFGMSPALPTAVAAQRTGMKKPKTSRPEADKAYSLDDIMKSPKEYQERQVFFYGRFATTANLFKNINTRFNANEHTNFAVWPDKTVLWDAKQRKNVLPTLYVLKNNAELIEQLRTIRKYELIGITAEVHNVYAGYPWMLVTKIERVELPSDRLHEPVIEHMQNGSDALSVEAGGVAARHFEQALQFGLPVEYRAKAYEQIAQAYLLDNRLDKARDYLRMAVAENRSDAVLNLALADVALRMCDAGEALAHCQFALEHSGRHPQVYGIMGEAKSITGDYVKAFNDLNAAYGTPGITSREKAMVNVRRARIYTRSGRHPDAARVYAAASESGEPLAGDAWLHNEVGLFYEMLYLDTGDARYLDSAYSAYEEASRLNRLDANYIYNMTEAEFRRQRLAEKPDFTLAKELITKINQVEPEYTPARILEGRVLWAEDKANEAEYRYQSVANQIGTDPIALMALAEAYMDLGRFTDAATAVKRARTLQPWNIRVQAIGDHLEKMAEAVAEMRAKTWGYDDSKGFDWECEDPGEKWYLGQFAPRRGPGQQPRQAPRQNYRPTQRMPEEYVEEYAQNPAPAPRGYGPLQRQNRPTQAQAPMQHQRQGNWQNRPGRREMQEWQEQQSRQGGYAERGEQYDNNGQPRRITIPAASDAGPAPRPSAAGPDSRYLTARQRDAQNPYGYEEYGRNGYDEGGMRGMDRGYPQDIQASARPAPLPGRPETPYPQTEVRLPEQRNRPERNVEAQPPAFKPLNLGYTPANGDAVGGRDEPVYDNRQNGHQGDYREEYNEHDRDLIRDIGYKTEPEKGNGKVVNQDFGAIPGVEVAYASMPIWEYDDPASGASTHPKAFSFEPDESPVIIAGMRAPEQPGRDMPVRNANLYRRNDGGRQPAEIIEKEPVMPRRQDYDTSVMAPAAGGVVHRAEIRLPSSSRGVGMSSDYDAGHDNGYSY